MSVNDIGDSLSYREAVDLAEELLQEQGSHLFAAVNGWKYPMGLQPMLTAALFLTVKNALRSDHEKPADFVWPWPGGTEAPQVTAEERDRLRAQLDANSAFANIRKG
ncbi:MAG: hypothetical protein HIU81_03910 [Acidobacteria bacterium]|nr:hypothetical protein [Acidobacteriota bacterium]